MIFLNIQLLVELSRRSIGVRFVERVHLRLRRHTLPVGKVIGSCQLSFLKLI